jgi:hypothetical protein
MSNLFMRTRLTIQIVFFTIFLAACKKEAVVLPDALITSKTNLTAQFTLLEQKIAAASAYLIQANMDTTLIRAKLLEVVNQFPSVVTFSYITQTGIIRILEPAVYYGSQGADISSQDHVVRTFATKMPVLSKQFFAAEGFYASAYIYPIVNSNSMKGALSALFKPESILGNIFKPLNEGQEFELWAIEKGGRLLYDPIASEIGNNLITDAMYQEFPELVTAVKKFDAEESGTTTFSYYEPGTTHIVKKLAYWTTFDLNGTEWKLIWSKPE